MLVGVMLLLVVGLALGMTERATAEPAFDVIMTGLNNPRGLAFGPDGKLYVAEAGIGGEGPCIDGPEGPACVGFSSGVSVYDMSETQTRLISDMVSLASPEGIGAGGLHDIAFAPNGDMYGVVGLGAHPDIRPISLGVRGPEFGQMFQISPSLGSYAPVADIAQYEADFNPTGDNVDSNPWGILLLSAIAEGDGAVFAVSDAGGNDVLVVNAMSGEIGVIATFPTRTVEFPPGMDFPMQSVPTALAPNPMGGDLLVGELTGFPFPVGGANIYSVTAGIMPSVMMSGFTNIVDMALAPTGRLYVLEIASTGLLDPMATGAVIEVSPNGSQRTIISDTLVFPGGITVGPDGMLYISNFSIFPGEPPPPPTGEANPEGAPTGMVIRVDPGAPTDVNLTGFGGEATHVALPPALLLLLLLPALIMWRRHLASN